jgi:hypothetical protein
MPDRYCCLCEKSLSSNRQIVENRPTGEFGEIEERFYCLSCWVEMKKLQQGAFHQKNLRRALNLVATAEE